MSNYLLLRDNKQSGPYSVDELKNKGLKPYDLVWLDGKSAAWRYPSEVEELKSFAPVVEEQPFDRFFKKPSQTSSSSSSSNISSSNISQLSNTGAIADPGILAAEALEEVPAIAKKEPFAAPVSPVVAPVVAEPVAASSSSVAPSAGRRIIYVTMPVTANKTVVPAREPAVSEAVRPQTGPDSDSPGRNTGESRSTLSDRSMNESFPEERSRNERGVKARSIEEDFSHESALGDTHFVEKKPHYNRPASSRIMRPLTLALSVIALVAAGVFIGLSINGRYRGIDHSSTGGEESATDRQARANAPLPVYTTAASNPLQKQDNLENNLSNGVITDPASPSNSKKTGEGSQKKKNVSLKDKTAMTGSQKSAADAAASARDSAALALLAQSGREASHRSDDAPDKESIKNAVVSQVSITTNKYNTGTFGGISELQLTVSNRSVYPLDLVVVEVQYIQSNKKVYKTENLYFRGIGPGSALMQEAPKSSRGIKVQSRIILINSKELGLSYSGI